MTNTNINFVNSKHKYRSQESSAHRPKSTMSRRKTTPASGHKIDATDAGHCIIRIEESVQLQTKGATIVACWGTLLLYVKTKERSDMLKPSHHTVIIVMNLQRLKIVRKSFM